MFVDGVDFTKNERNYLLNLTDWKKRWRKLIIEDAFGCPSPSMHDWLSSDNLIHHAYHFAMFEEATRKGIKSLKFIVEFGGGYGSMCRLAFRMGFSGKYVIFDLPAFSALQKYYLMNLKLNIADSLTEFQKMKEGIFCVSDLIGFSQSLPIYKGDSLFLATWSLSETPLNTREIILESIDGFESYLITYQEKFGEMDNTAFFNAWKNQKKKNWYCSPIQHLPKNYYLIGA
jgi:hypothetical protein